MNAFKLLGISRNATQQEIRTAYLLKVKEAHPDSPTGSDAKFKEIHQAYLSLKGLKHKKSYEESSDIDFKNIIKFYSRANPYRKTHFDSRPKESNEKVDRSVANFFQSFVYASAFLYLWNMNSDSDIGQEFHEKYLKECNQVDYGYYDEAISHVKKLNNNPNIYA